MTFKLRRKRPLKEGRRGRSTTVGNNSLRAKSLNLSSKKGTDATSLLFLRENRHFKLQKNAFFPLLKEVNGKIPHFSTRK